MLIYATVDLADTRTTLFTLVCVLASWLHLACGLSRAATDRVLRLVEVIVFLAIVDLGRIMTFTKASIAPTITTSRQALSLPHDVQKAMSALLVEPTIIRSICCPNCFAKYTFDSLPQVCLRRETPRGKPCGENLWTTHATRGGPRLVPRRLYSTQTSSHGWNFSSHVLELKT
jgi:hypothetical protein